MHKHTHTRTYAPFSQMEVTFVINIGIWGAIYTYLHCCCVLFRARWIQQKISWQYFEGAHCVSKKHFFIKNALKKPEAWGTYQYYSRHLRFTFLRSISLLCKVCLSKRQLFGFVGLFLNCCAYVEKICLGILQCKQCSSVGTDLFS